MITFIDKYKAQYGVEPICKLLPIAPSTYYHHRKQRIDPELRSTRAKRDEYLKVEIYRVWDQNYRVYGIRKIWHQLKREGICVARCTVARLMKALGIQGVRRGKSIKTTFPDETAVRPMDLVEREFIAERPNQLWVADITYVRTWTGCVFTAFVVDVFSNGIVGWKVSNSLKTGLALDALEQAIYMREIDQPLIHHSDRGVQYLSIKYTERLSESGIESSVGSRGDSYDNALAESINGPYITELIKQRGPWRNMEQVEFETLKWVDWYNNKRLMEPLKYQSPAEYEKKYYSLKPEPHKEVLLT